MKSASRWLVTSCLFALTAPPASATIQEVEPNETFATAQDIGSLGSFDSEQVNASLASGDVDFYSVFAPSGTLLIVSVFDYTSTLPDDHNSILAVFDPEGVLLTFDDDGGPGLMSAFAVLTVYSGNYFIAVSGSPDFAFVGDHDEAFDYHLVVYTAPAPSVLSLGGVGALMLVKRRRRGAT